MKHTIAFLTLCCLLACHTPKQLHLPKTVLPENRLTGSEFFKQTTTANWNERDSIAVQQILAGNMPSFLTKLEPVHSSFTDSTGKKHHAVFWVTPDYISVGADADWARVPLTPMASQMIADSLGCFLPTRKMVDLIYTQASIKLEPIPMFAYRDSSVTMWQHHLIIEGQRKGKRGLIAGIKKDLVISGSLLTHDKKDRVAIYGWHRLDGSAIQPLYTGHVNWYVDYSHGTRLVAKWIKVNGEYMNYEDVLKDPVLQKLICVENRCDHFRYQ